MRTVTAGIIADDLTTAARVHWQLRRLRRAEHAGRPLDALVAAARIHALVVRPSMRCGRWPRARICCERVLNRLPARLTPGYSPRLRGVIECLHADAARAAREAGDLQRARLHLIALIGYLRDRRAPLARQVAVTIDLAEVYIAAGDARAGGRILASIGPMITDYPPRPAARRRPASAPGRPRRPPSAGLLAALAVPAQRQASD